MIYVSTTLLAAIVATMCMLVLFTPADVDEIPNGAICRKKYRKPLLAPTRRTVIRMKPSRSRPAGPCSNAPFGDRLEARGFPSSVTTATDCNKCRNERYSLAGYFSRVRSRETY